MQLWVDYSLTAASFAISVQMAKPVAVVRRRLPSLPPSSRSWTASAYEADTGMLTKHGVLVGPGREENPIRATLGKDLGEPPNGDREPASDRIFN